MAGGRYNPRKTVGGSFCLVLLLVAGSQIAIGSLNDYCDRRLDAAGDRHEKPLVSGVIRPFEAIALACAGSTIALLATLSLGPAVWVLGLLILGLGLAYDLRFKALPGALSRSLSISHSFRCSLGRSSGAGSRSYSLFFLGAALGIAMNISNTLPDLDADLAAGMRGLPHLLGRQWGAALAWTTPLLALAIIWLLNLTRLVPETMRASSLPRRVD